MSKDKSINVKVIVNWAQRLISLSYFF